MKRVWKPLDVGGLRLYEVVQSFPGHRSWDEKYIVAATSPSQAAKIISDIYRDTEYRVDPFYHGRALNIFMPEEWWWNGVPQE